MDWFLYDRDTRDKRINSAKLYLKLCQAFIIKLFYENSERLVSS